MARHASDAQSTNSSYTGRHQAANEPYSHGTPGRTSGTGIIARLKSARITKGKGK